MSGGRAVARAPVAYSDGPAVAPTRGMLCPRPTMPRPSPDVGRNQWKARLMTCLR